MTTRQKASYASNWDMNLRLDNPDQNNQTLTGYLHPNYAKSLAEFGTPRELPQCGGWILERQIPGFPDRDAMGCYPLFVCRDWSKLHLDLADIGDNLVSLALVTDPFAAYDQASLRQSFEVVIPFKDHFVINLDRPMREFVSDHHRYYARKALKKIQVEKCDDPIRFTTEWVALYGYLIERHEIEGVRAFSDQALTQHLHIPGLVMFRAIYRETTVGAFLWFLQGEVGYAHLISFSQEGFKLGASYALFWSAIEYFSTQLHWLDIGGSAGLVNDPADGLNFFKRGWSTETRTAYFCGRIINHKRYTEIAQAKGIAKTEYFPAYRKGEFT
jgi:hypothetical protein